MTPKAAAATYECVSTCAIQKEKKSKLGGAGPGAAQAPPPFELQPNVKFEILWPEICYEQ